jgi:hypothetical protein
MLIIHQGSLMKKDRQKDKQESNSLLEAFDKCEKEKV